MNGIVNDMEDSREENDFTLQHDYGDWDTETNVEEQDSDSSVLEPPSIDGTPDPLQHLSPHDYANGSSHAGDHGGTGAGHRRNVSAATTRTVDSGVLNKRFSIQPQSLSRPVEDSDDDHEWLPTSDTVVGEEPGVNVETMTVDLEGSIGSEVKVIDYSKEACIISYHEVEKGGSSMISGSSDPSMLARPLRDALQERPEWSRVRWIVVNGLSWEAIHPIALHYKLHPLAVEDMLDIPQRVKVEAFDGQTFCCFPLHVLNTTSTPTSAARNFLRGVLAWLTTLWQFLRNFSASLLRTWHHNSHEKYDEKYCEDHEEKQGLPRTVQDVYKQSSASSSTSYGSKKNYIRGDTRGVSGSEERFELPAYGAETCIPFYTLDHRTLCRNTEPSELARKLQALPSRSIYEWNRGNLLLQREALQNMRIPGSSNSFEMGLEQVSMFVVNDTVITFFEKSAPAIYGPLEYRLMSPATLLRQTSDPSILVQAVLDASVDMLGPILNEYQRRLHALQIVSVPRPNLAHTRALHSFITDMTVLRPHLTNLYQVIEALWPKLSASHKTRNPSKPTFTDFNPEKESKRRKQHHRRLTTDVTGLYFSDVSDHVLRYLQDLDDMRNQSKTLSSLLFNTISIRASDSVKLLSLVSVVFLPLSFLTGYFGMNFKSFDVLDHDVGYYWMVSTPAAAALTVLLVYPSLAGSIKEMLLWFCSY